MIAEGEVPVGDSVEGSRANAAPAREERAARPTRAPGNAGYRSGGDSRSDSGGGRRTRPRFFRPRRSVCLFCVDKKVIDYKDVGGLTRFVDAYGKIRAARKTGTCAKHQRRLAVAIKRARHLALLPFATSRVHRAR
jgi:small subunit ribosomal protein S18